MRLVYVLNMSSSLNKDIIIIIIIKKSRSKDLLLSSLLISPAQREPCGLRLTSQGFEHPVVCG